MNTYTKEQKLEHLKLLRASGNNCNEYCRETGLPRSTMHAWVHAFNEQGVGIEPSMVKLPARPAPPKPTSTIILSIGPWSATITSGASRSDLEVLVSVLGGACHAN